MNRLILASQSPRRQELIRNITGDCEIIASNAAEVLPAGIPPEEAPVCLSAVKARDVARTHPGRIVIGADTVVIIDGRVLGKPSDAQEAARMLNTLSGRTHTVITGCSIVCNDRIRSFSESTSVTFYPLSDREIAEYIETGEPFDKAGSYGIQGRGMLFVKKIDGDYFNVMGLPVGKLYRELKLFREESE